MIKYLIKDVTTYRVSTVEEVELLHEQLLEDRSFELVAFSYKTKHTKATKNDPGEEYQLVKAEKVFNEEKLPNSNIDVQYEVKF